MEVGHYTIQLRNGQQVTVVSVPAMQLAVPTGVYLDSVNQFHIKAVGGLVMTVGGLPRMPRKTLDDTNYPDVSKDLLISDLDRDSNPGWRKPDGTLYYGKGAIYDPTKDDPERANHKLIPGAEYGCLLAFVVPRNTQYPDDVFKYMASNNVVFLEIGDGDTIKYDSSNKEYYLENKHYVNGVRIGHTLPSNGEIYLTINDVLVKDKNDINLSQKQKDDAKLTLENQAKRLIDDEGEAEILEAESDEEKAKTISDAEVTLKDNSELAVKVTKELQLDSNTTAMYYEAQREIVTNSLRGSYGIWYLDNRGSFTVSIIKGKD